MCVKSNSLCPYPSEVWGDLLGSNRRLDFNPPVDSFLQRLIKADFKAASFLHLHIERSRKHQLAPGLLLINRSCQTEQSRPHFLPVARAHLSARRRCGRAALHKESPRSLYGRLQPPRY